MFARTVRSSLSDVHGCIHSDLHNFQLHVTHRIVWQNIVTPVTRKTMSYLHTADPTCQPQHPLMIQVNFSHPSHSVNVSELIIYTHAMRKNMHVWLLSLAMSFHHTIDQYRCMDHTELEKAADGNDDHVPTWQLAVSSRPHGWQTQCTYPYQTYAAHPLLIW